MKINDSHVHASGKETPGRIEKALDINDIEMIVLISPHPYLLKNTTKTMSIEEFMESIRFMSRIQKELYGRVYGFAFIDPRMTNDVKKLVELVEWSITDMDLVGVKMIPAGWYPYDEKIYPIYEKLEELNAPILFHCGISWGFPDSSRYCRPVFYEALMKFPKLRFSLAHLCWPWVDEALAVGGRFYYPIKFRLWDNISSDKPQVILDISSGAPLIWKIDALRKAIVYLGHKMLMFGSDCIGADNPECYRECIRRDMTILRDMLARNEEELEYIFYKNFVWFVKGK
ncbi:MAG: amidohydrolase family protein [Staphylothermus sp.]|nr:amidohydrolase family protein [Staphylothermus sp.]